MNSWFKPLKTDSRKRMLMALLGGAAAIGIAKSAAQTSPVPLLGGGSGGSGGGGGSGLQTAASLTALAALAPTSGGAAYLASSPNAGFFAWEVGNYEPQISNDPGQGIYVAWSSDSAPGATGAWVRNWNGTCDWAWWGVIADATFTQGADWTTTAASGTDNYNALVNWQIWARYQSSLGLPVRVKLGGAGPTGAIGWSQQNVTPGAPGGLYWVSGIQNLDIDFGGCTMQNLTSGAPGVAAFPIAALSPTLTSYLIQQTTPGVSSVTLVTPSQGSNLSVGQWVLVASCDVQHLGFPFNVQYYQFVQISAINTSTGVITTTLPIIDEHRTDFPDYTLSGASYACGVARIWTLDVGAAVWNVNHTYRNVQVNQPPNHSGPSTYATITGRQITIDNWVGVGFSPTVSSSVKISRSAEMSLGEIDKLVETLVFEDMNSPYYGLNVQSTCPRFLHVRGGIIGGVGGLAQSALFEGVDIRGSVSASCVYGLSRGALFDNCKILTPGGSFGYVTDGGTPLKIDGTIASYANGIITLNLALLGYGIATWSFAPGMGLVLQAIGSDSAAITFSGNAGFGIVTGVTQDIPGPMPNYIYIATTLPYLTLPSWINTGTYNLYLLHCGPVEMRNCTGSLNNDFPRLASAAYSASQRYFEYFEQIIAGVTSASAVMYPEGTLESVCCNVINPGTVSAATLKLAFLTYNNQTFVADTPGYTIVTFNIGVAGKRKLTTTEFDGVTGTDGITVAGSSVDYLPANRATIACTGTFSNVPANPNQAPLVELIIATDCGIARKILPATFFGGNYTSGAILGIQGQVQ